MPYAGVKDLPAAVKTKLKSNRRRRQWLEVFNSAYDKHKSESIAFAMAWATANKADGFGKASEMNDFQFFMPIVKVEKNDDGTCVVSGYASTPAKDSDGEIVTLKAVKAALPDYMQWRNIREMHQLKAVGKAQEANIDEKGLWLSAKIVDPIAVKKCVDEVYQGFSIGGRKLAKVGDKITSLEMTEISVVDRPANSECSFKLAKSAKTASDEPGYLVKVKRSPSDKALIKMTRIVEDLVKAGPPAAHDGFSLPAKVNGTELSPNDSRPGENATRKTDDAAVPCEPHGKIGCEKCAVEKREFDEKERQQAADSGAAMPDGSYPIKDVKDLENAIQALGRAKNPGKAKAHIKARAKALGATDKLPDSWSKQSKAAKKLAKAKLAAAFGLHGNSFLTLKKAAEPTEPSSDDPFVLRKGMRTVGSLAYSFDSLRDSQRSLLLEARTEGGDKKDKVLAGKLGSIAKDIAGVIAEKATHEGGEALDMSDADDSYLSSLLGEDFDMSKTMMTGSGDPLTDAVQALMKKAATPSKAQRMQMADDDVKKARKACKAARDSLEEAHKMHKAAYMAKAAKKPNDKDDKDEEFDHAGAMEKLQKAYGEIDKALTMAKAARVQLAKAASRSGQRGEEAGDPESGFYEVPAGVTDLTPAAMAGAAPGTKSGGSQPPMYPGDGSVYAGKAAEPDDLRKFANKDGMVPASVVSLLMEKRKADGELEALRRLPATALTGGRRPYAFDARQIVGNGSGNANNSNQLQKAIFDGVDVNAIGSGDEQAHSAAVAKAAGNLILSGQFGKSMMDPAFRGMQTG